jgi:signal peptidase I
MQMKDIKEKNTGLLQPNNASDVPHLDTTQKKEETGAIKTTQSLVVAFVLAMVFRGFVVEGFVIPTGSMAPTLLGQHLLKHSDQTGKYFPVGFDIKRNIGPERFVDPLLGRTMPLPTTEAKKIIPRSGDRVLVLKMLYPFFEPERFDVVVFKNPTDTQGLAANYIKRLIGLPNETIWIADGEIFAKKGDGQFAIQRKPEHVQKSIWSSVSNSDAIPTDKLALPHPWQGPPWRALPEKDWSIDGRTWKCDGGEARLLWDNQKMPIDDWLSYNLLLPRRGQEPMSDIRVGATIIPQGDALVVGLELHAVGHIFEWSIAGSKGTLAKQLDGDPSSLTTLEFDIDPFRVGKPTRVEFWHVDQMLAMYIDNQRVGEMLYDYGPEERLRLVTKSDKSVPIEEIAGRGGAAPKLSWHFKNAPFTMSRVSVDHDLYYRSDLLQPSATKNPTMPGNEKLVEVGSPAFGTHPDKLAVLGPNQFMMAGDNSTYSSDGRLWGNPDEFVAAQIDTAPFLVNRDLLIGKAWCVYWPSAFRLGNFPIIPDFGSVRFIR